MQLTLHEVIVVSLAFNFRWDFQFAAFCLLKTNYVWIFIVKDRHSLFLNIKIHNALIYYNIANTSMWFFIIKTIKEVVNSYSYLHHSKL